MIGKSKLLTALTVATMLSTFNITSAETLDITGQTFENKNISSTENISVKLNDTSVWRYDPETNIVYQIDGTKSYSMSELLDRTNGNIIDPETGNIIGNVSGFVQGSAINATNYDSINITNSKFINNKVSLETTGEESFLTFTAASGGAVNTKGKVLVDNSYFSGNSAKGKYTYSETIDYGDFTEDLEEEYEYGMGGAISNVGDLTVTSSTFVDNSANTGGAIINEGTTNIKDSNFANNTADTLFKYKSKYTINGEEKIVDSYEHDGSGGAIYNEGDLNVENAQFVGNKAAEDGGAIYSYGNTTIKNVLFHSNTAKSENDVGGYYDTDEVGNPVFYREKSIDGLGGAIAAFGEDKNKLLVEDSTFINNVSGSDGGGAVATFVNTEINSSVFLNNETSGTGGAIVAVKNSDTMTELNVTNSVFENNKAVTTQNYDPDVENFQFETYAGGAIATNGNVTVKDSKFKGNIVESKNITDINEDYGNGNFIKTQAESSSGVGGAIAVINQDLETTPILDIQNSLFENNSAASMGGAIYSGGKLNINHSEFNNNTSSSFSKSDGGYKLAENISLDQHYTSYDGFGGAISANDDVTIDDSIFIGNQAAQGGGAIFSRGGDKVVVKNSTFKNNSAKSEQKGYRTYTNSEGEQETENLDKTNGYGGAIAVYGPEGTTARTLLIENSVFEGNSSGDDGGGAVATGVHTKITDSLFTGNSTTGDGGAIVQRYGNLNIKDTDFIGNSAEKSGGAIFTGDKDFDPSGGNVMPEMTITAQNKDVLFSENKAEKGSDIYAQNTIINLNANEGKNITFNGGITGKNSIININDSSKELYENMNSIGTIVINNFVSPEAGSTLAVNHNAGTLKLAMEDYLNGTDLNLKSGSTLDLTNNHIGIMQLNSLTSDNANLNIDADFANTSQNFDFITANSANGTLNLKSINIMSDMVGDTNNISVNLADLGVPETLKINVQAGGINTLTTDYAYTITGDGSKIDVERLKDSDGNALLVDGFTLAVNQNDKINGNEINLSDDRTYSATRDFSITAGENYEKGWTGELGGTSLTVNGNGYTLDGKNNTGLLVKNGQALNLNDTNIKGFTTTSDRKGVLTVKEDGQLNISAINNNVSLGDNLNTNIIYLDDTSSAANLTTENNKELTVNGSIKSNDATNTLNLRGNGRITFNGVVDPLTINNDNADTVHNNYIDDVTYNLNSGMVTFAKDEYLKGQGNKNTLNFNGGTLNLANGSISLIDLASLNINSNSNIMVDADLANKSMDTFTADNATAAEGAILNVSGINLLSDATQNKTEINAVDPTITLTTGESLASHISTSVGDVAYSSIYKYGVDYNPTTGNFTFSRGSSGDYNNLNPAVMAGPVAAQVGGYLGMIDTYNHAFNTMDMRMLMPSSLRAALKQVNRYALADSKSGAGYTFSENDSGSTWIRPFAAYDSIGLKHGPKVHSMSYGTFLGGESSIHEFKNGFEGVLGAHISYLGSHQTYAGNTIWQNGGNVGLTGNLYKGNFFTGLTFSTGASLADASTRYGSDDIPMFMLGAASKTGYNIEFKDGRFILQPSLLMSYTFVNTFNYTNAGGVKMDAAPLHAFQISPNVRFAFNTKTGWQPYLSFGVNWNIMNHSEFMANAAQLPYLSVKPYFQYGLGIQRIVNDYFSAYGQVLLRNGGRNGIAASFGTRFMLGIDSSKYRQQL